MADPAPGPNPLAEPSRGDGAAEEPLARGGSPDQDPIDWLQNIYKDIQTLIYDGQFWGNVAIAIAILFAAWLVGRILGAAVDKSFSRGNERASKLLRSFCVIWTRRGIFLVGVFMALEFLGVPIGPVLAGLGVAGFIIGFAVQGTLSNFASGLMLLIYSPFDVDDVVEINGTLGTVKDLSVVNTTLVTPDNRLVFMPNSGVWDNQIINYTKQPTRRVDMTLGVSYDADLDQVRELVLEWLQKHDKVLAEPAPAVEVSAHADSAIIFNVRPWVNTPDYWPIYWEAHRELKKLLDANDIEIPFPQRVVHMPKAD